MLWLQDTIIVLLRIKLFNKQAGFPLAAMLDQSTKIGAPASEVVIHIDHRNSCRFGPPLQSCNFVSQLGDETSQLFRLGEIEIVNYVHNDQGNLRFVGGASMQISVLTAQRFSWSRVRHRSVVAINKSRLGSRTNAALQIPQKITRTFSLACVFAAMRRTMVVV